MGGREPIDKLQDRYGQALVIGLAALLAAALVALALEHRDRPKPLEITAQATPTAGGPIQVYITGAVAQPGVYEMHDGDRVVDLLYKAGGQAADADMTGVNLAVRLHDEDQVTVPRTGQAAAGGVTAGQTSQVAGANNGGGLININTATASELDALPGIGAVYGQRIVESRTTSGSFTTIDDLINRKLVPQATYTKIRDLITTGP